MRICGMIFIKSFGFLAKYFFKTSNLASKVQGSSLNSSQAFGTSKTLKLTFCQIFSSRFSWRIKEEISSKEALFTQSYPSNSNLRKFFVKNKGSFIAFPALVCIDLPLQRPLIPSSFSLMR